MASLITSRDCWDRNELNVGRYSSGISSTKGGGGFANKVPNRDDPSFFMMVVVVVASSMFGSALFRRFFPTSGLYPTPS